MNVKMERWCYDKGGNAFVAKWHHYKCTKGNGWNWLMHKCKRGKWYMWKWMVHKWKVHNVNTWKGQNDITISAKLICMKRESRKRECMKGGKHENGKCEYIQNTHRKLGKWNDHKYGNEMREHMKTHKRF